MTCPLCKEKLERKILHPTRRRVVERCTCCSFRIYHGGTEHPAKA